jgi:hypothetical protein
MASYKDSNEPSGFVKGGESEYVDDCWLVKNSAT